MQAKSVFNFICSLVILLLMKSFNIQRVPDIPSDKAAGMVDASPSLYEKSTFWSPAHAVVAYPGDRPYPAHKHFIILICYKVKIV